MKRLLAITCLVGFALAFPVAAAEEGSEDNWKIRWSEDFIGPAGSLPDPRHWTVEAGNDGFGTGQLQAYTARPQNVSLDGQGDLVITALRESYGGMAYTSARIGTRDKSEFRYGAIEIRAKLPFGAGVGAAAWTGGFGKGVAWPKCGQRGIFEVFGADFGRVVSRLVGASQMDEKAPVSQAEPFIFPEGQGVNGWHVYRHEYLPARGNSPEEMRFYVDGKMYRRSRPQWFPGVWTFNQFDHFLVLNIAIGGDNPWGLPDPTTPFPQRMIVDYARLYDLQQ